MDRFPSIQTHTTLFAFGIAGLVSVATLVLAGVSETTTESFVNFIMGLYAFIPPLGALIWRESRPFGSLFPLWKPKQAKWNLGVNFAYGVLGIGLVITAELCWHSVFGDPTQPQPVEQMLHDLQSQPVWFLALASYALVFAPVFEELLFRRILLVWIAQTCKGCKQLSTVVAVLVSALMFAVFHADPERLPVITADGIVLGVLFVRTKNLTVAVLTHATVNAIALIEFLLK